jgi:hypothetical protein
MISQYLWHSLFLGAVRGGVGGGGSYPSAGAKHHRLVSTAQVCFKHDVVAQGQHSVCLVDLVQGFGFMSGRIQIDR